MVHLVLKHSSEFGIWDTTSTIGWGNKFTWFYLTVSQLEADMYDKRSWVNRIQYLSLSLNTLVIWRGFMTTWFPYAMALPRGVLEAMILRTFIRMKSLCWSWESALEYRKDFNSWEVSEQQGTLTRHETALRLLVARCFSPFRVLRLTIKATNHSSNWSLGASYRF